MQTIMEITPEILAQVAAITSVVTTAALSGGVAAYRYFTKGRRAQNEQQKETAILETAEAKADAKIEKLHKQVDMQWQARLDHIQNELAAHKALYQQLQEAYQVDRATSAETEKRLEQRIAHLEGELDRANEARQRLEDKLAATQKDLRDAQGQIADLQLIRTRLEARNEAQDETIQILRGLVEPMRALVEGVIVDQTRRNAA